MGNEQTPTILTPESAAELADFARSCKAAARAVSLYPNGHPAIGTSLGRLAQITAKLTAAHPFRMQVSADRLLVEGAAAAKTDPAVTELADLLHRHLIGGLTLNAGIDADSWRTLLLLLARAPEDVRSDGGIAHLWGTAGGPSIEINEIDYAEVLREKQGLAAAVEQIVAAAMAGPQLQLDDSGMRLLLEIVSDQEKLDELMKKLVEETAKTGVDAHTGAFLKLVQALAEWVGANEPARLEGALNSLARAAGRLTADGMLSLLARRTKPEAAGGAAAATDAEARTAQLAGEVIDRMPDAAIATFVAGSVIAERGATDRLAHAFQALVPDTHKQRQLLALAQEEVAASEFGHEENFEDLWGRVEGMLASYSDKGFVSDDYARELSAARTQPLDVERTSDDPPERIAAWLATVADSALRSLDHQLLSDLLRIEEDPLRWRDIADTAVAHAEDLVRVGYFDQAWHLADTVVEQGGQDSARKTHASVALERLGKGSMLKHVATHLRGSDEEGYERFKRLCHSIGTPVIAPLAEVLAAEQDARSRRRLRDVLVGFGARGRESVQQLMHSSNWEVRRTAAYLLREFGGSEGLKELIPLLTDSEPLVQREAVQGLVWNGSQEAARILLTAITSATGRSRDALLNELGSVKDERAAPVFIYLLRYTNWRAQTDLHLLAIDALGTSGAAAAVEPLKAALYEGTWWSPGPTKRLRAAAAQALRRIGTPAALETLRQASENGPRGVRAAARAEVSRLG
jgi:hypothetical protein